MRGGPILNVYREQGTVELVESAMEAFFGPQRLPPGKSQTEYTEQEQAFADGEREREEYLKRRPRS
jgi:hypothetical protein